MPARAHWSPRGSRLAPLAPHHEGVGLVEAVGANVPTFDFLTDPLFWVVALAALVAAVVRGFSGFGAGLIFMPVAAACLGPKPAAGILYVIDTILILPFVAKAVRIVDWRDVLPLGIGAVRRRAARRRGASPRRSGAAPLGPVARHPRLDRRARRGLRYRGPTRVPLSLAVGAVAGFLSGSVQIPGPPVLIYWLGRKVVSATMRANAIVFFMFTTVDLRHRLSLRRHLHRRGDGRIARALSGLRASGSSSAAASSAAPARRPIAASPTRRSSSRRSSRCRCSGEAREILTRAVLSSKHEDLLHYRRRMSFA